jgi:hypothetical protein
MIMEERREAIRHVPVHRVEQIRRSFESDGAVRVTVQSEPDGSLRTVVATFEEKAASTAA